MIVSFFSFFQLNMLWRAYERQPLSQPAAGSARGTRENRPRMRPCPSQARCAAPLLRAPGSRRRAAQRPALFSRLCFKYLTNIAPSLCQIPRPGCRPGTRVLCGAERGARGLEEVGLGTPRVARVTPAIRVTCV